MVVGASAPQSAFMLYNHPTETNKETHMKKPFKNLGIYTLALSACLTLAGTASAAGIQATGNTALTVKVPSFVILYYPTALQINFADIVSGGHDAVVAVNTTPMTESGATLDTAIVVDAPTGLLNTKTIAISNAWAVRGLTLTGTAKISITPSLTLTNGTGTLPVALTVTTDQSTNMAANAIQTLHGMSAQYGIVNMTFDMASLGGASGFSGNYGATNYTITVDGT